MITAVIVAAGQQRARVHADDRVVLRGSERVPRVRRVVPANRPKFVLLIVDGSRDFEKMTVTTALGPILVDPPAGVIDVMAGAAVSAEAAAVKLKE